MAKALPKNIIVHEYNFKYLAMILIRPENGESSSICIDGFSKKGMAKALHFFAGIQLGVPFFIVRETIIHRLICFKGNVIFLTILDK